MITVKFYPNSSIFKETLKNYVEVGNKLRVMELDTAKHTEKNGQEATDEALVVLNEINKFTELDLKDERDVVNLLALFDDFACPDDYPVDTAEQFISFLQRHRENIIKAYNGSDV